jgi:hypothetical protein
MRRAIIATACTLLLAVLVASPAHAAFGVNAFHFGAEAEGGAPVTQAGSHPFAVKTTFGLNYTGTETQALPGGQLRNLVIHLPAGFAGAPSAVPECPHADFLDLNPETAQPSCPDSSAIGVTKAEILAPGPPAPRAVYNLSPPPGAVAEFGFVAVSVPVTIDFYLSQSPPYEVVAKVTNTSSAAKIFGSELTIWGDPASPVHDAERGGCILVQNGHCPAGVDEKPFLTLPRACGGPLFTTYSALSWQGDTDEGSSVTPLETSGCTGLGFNPEIGARPTTTTAESPTGLEIEVGVEDPGLTDASAGATADSDIRSIEFAFPEGMSVNPSAGEGQGACAPAQLAAETLTEQGCPEASKLGTVEVETPLLEGEVLPGSVYLATQDDNPFHSLLALYVVIKDPQLGILIKQPTSVTLDPTSGRLTSTVEELPQLPFSSLRVHLRSGARAPLLTPRACGTYTTTAKLTPWASGVAPITASSSFEVDSGCRGAATSLAPSFTAGTAASAAGTYSPLSLRITRNDGEPELDRFSAALAPGLLGKLAGVSYCPESAIAAARAKSGREELTSPSCPASSLVGHLQAGAGVGNALTWVGGSLYLAGPYAGDPLSIVAVTPALAGPLDLGDVVVREGLKVSEYDARVEVDSSASEPFPHILAGIPLHLRDLRVHADRPGFTLNATNCEPLSSAGQIFGLGVASPFTAPSPYQASHCGALGFKPKLALSMKGATRRSGHPALRAVLTYPRQGAYANIARAQVGLPHSAFLDQGNLDKVCTQPELRTQTCPASSIYGRARAWTPLLEKPLEGPVYLAVGFGYNLPALVAELNGQIRVLLKGKVDTTRQAGIRNTFEAVPDAPVEKFELRLKGGRKYGLLENSEDVCRKTQRAAARFTAQNGRSVQLSPVIANGCEGSRHDMTKPTRGDQ